MHCNVILQACILKECCNTKKLERMSSYEEYAFHAFYFDRGSNEYDVHITATPNIPIYIESVQKVYEDAEQGSKVLATEITDEVLFTLPGPHESTDGMELTPMIQPLILQKSTIEEYEPGKPVPHIPLHLKLRGSSKPLMARVNITGKPPPCVITLTKRPMSIEEAEIAVKKLLEEEGTFKQKNMVVVLTGLMEAGKTTLLNRMFGKSLQYQYSSTGIAERSWRSISRHVIATREFKSIDLMELFEIVATNIHRKSEEIGDNSRDKETDGTVEQMKNHNNIPVAKPKEVIDKKETPISVMELVNCYRKNPKDYGEIELVHMIDTGGQPECLEILPSLIHNADLTLLVVNVSIPLDQCTVPTLHTHGQKHEKRNLPTTNRHIIEQVAHTMAGKSNSKIMVIATHTDCIIEETKRQRAISELECLMKNILPAEALLARNKYSPVFEVNLLDPETTIVPSICEDISSRCKTMAPVKVPPSFVLFEREATLYINKQERKIQVLNFNECLKIGKLLGMTDNTIEAALTYFHNNNILLFFKNIGSGIVFLEPKVLVDFVNDIVGFSYLVEKEVHPSITVAQTEAICKGMITTELLSHKTLTKNFLPGLFEASHAIEIFKKIYIIAKSTKKMEYIMMCLLPRLTEEKKNKLVPATAVEPLIIYFEESVSPSGSFGNTIACLISNFKWKICTNEDEEPVCLYHDIVKLYPNDEGLKVTFVNKIKYFEVYAEVSFEDKHRCSKLPKIKENVNSAVKEVLNTMKMQLKVLMGFKCLCKLKKKSKFHIIPLLESRSTYLECQCGEKINLDPRSLVWINTVYKDPCIVEYLYGDGEVVSENDEEMKLLKKGKDDAVFLQDVYKQLIKNKVVKSEHINRVTQANFPYVSEKIIEQKVHRKDLKTAISEVKEEYRRKTK